MTAWRDAWRARELAKRTPWAADYCMEVIRARDRIAPDMTAGGFADLVMRFGLEGLIAFADAAKVYIEGTSPLTGCLRGRMRQVEPVEGEAVLIKPSEPGAEAD